MKEKNMTVLSIEQLDELERMLEKATPGPWRVEPDERALHDSNGHDRPGTEYIAGYDIRSPDKEIIGCEGITSADSTDADTIAALRNAAPELIAMARHS